MANKKLKENRPYKKYYIMDFSSKTTPVEDYRFGREETCLQLLVDSECFHKNLKDEKKKNRLEKRINEIGFEWDPLSEPGHMRQMPYAHTIMEAIEKYIWCIADEFCGKQGILLHRISGGELFVCHHPEIGKQIALISKNLIYGTNQYNVMVNQKKQILRYSACTQKLSLAKEIGLHDKNLPVGIFEISKSYRFEIEDDLQLCKRVRSFHLPELHIINDSLASSLELSLPAHTEILNGIKKLFTDYELLCSVTYDFFKNNFDFLKTIVRSANKPLLLAVYDEGVSCGNGIKLDIEYMVFDTLISPVEIATLQIDDGTSDFAFGVKYKTKKGIKKPVSTMHTVFFSSIERAAYSLIDRAIKIEAKTGFLELPFWASPVQARVIPHNRGALEDAKMLVKELISSGFRVDLDDRKIHYDLKKRAKDLKWIPYVINVDDNNEVYGNLIIENNIKGINGKAMRKNDLIKKMKAENTMNIIIPQYFPRLLSQRIIANL